MHLPMYQLQKLQDISEIGWRHSKLPLSTRIRTCWPTRVYAKGSKTAGRAPVGSVDGRLGGGGIFYEGQFTFNYMRA
jgi:hypothetical protein